jgi:hypothetical protein
MTSPSASAEDGAGSGLHRGARRHRLNVWKKFNVGGGVNATSSSSTTSPSASSSGGGDNPAAAAGSPQTATAGATDDPDVGGGLLPPSDYDEEHPMRTDEWRLDIRLSRLRPAGEGELFPECVDVVGFETTTPAGRRAASGDGDPPGFTMFGGQYRKRQVMQFARNGYVRVVGGDERGGGGGGGGGMRRGKPRVGKWRIGHSGVAFDIPVPVAANGRRWRGVGGNDNEDDNGAPSSSRRMTVLHYHAEIHLNKFGERPRMFRGVITRDR